MNKIDQSLLLCVAKDDCREWMNHPFTIGDKSYSTNGHILCITPKTESYPNPPINYESQNVLNIIPKGSEPILTLTKEDMNAIIEVCPKIDGYDLVGKDVECECCDGHGSVDFEYDWKCNTYYNEGDCPICEGSGLQEGEKKVPNGTKVCDGDSLIKIGLSYFIFSTLNIVFEISKIMDAEPVLTNQADVMKPSVFKIGEIELLVMPCYNNFENLPIWVKK